MTTFSVVLVYVVNIRIFLFNLLGFIILFYFRSIFISSIMCPILPSLAYLFISKKLSLTLTHSNLFLQLR